MKCHQINDKTERNLEKQTFQDYQIKFITKMARPPSQAEEKLSTQQKTAVAGFK
jgi:hypothetical protein